MPRTEGADASSERWELSRRRFLRNVGAAAALPALGTLTEGLWDMPASASVRERAAAARRIQRGEGSAEALFGSHPGYRFAFVNHATTNAFFLPTRHGAQDACTLLGCSYSWSGSPTSEVKDMASALDAAISARVDGIATTVIDARGLVAATSRALEGGTPVVTYNASAPPSATAEGHQLAYVGQDLFQAGVKAGRRMLEVVRAGDLVAGFIATPGSLNLQPRIDGAASVLAPAGVDFRTVATGPLLPEQATATAAWYLEHRAVKFLYAVDAGSTAMAANVVERHHLRGDVHVGGFDFLPTTAGAVLGGHQLWTIDQQPYLQGFLPVLQLFLHNVSGGLVTPASTDTGCRLVDKSAIGDYLAPAPGLD